MSVVEQNAQKAPQRAPQRKAYTKPALRSYGPLGLLVCGAAGTRADFSSCGNCTPGQQTMGFNCSELDSFLGCK